MDPPILYDTTNKNRYLDNLIILWHSIIFLNCCVIINNPRIFQCIVLYGGLNVLRFYANQMELGKLQHFFHSIQCMLWSWYLSNDTQFYIIAILILLISVRHFRIAAILLVTFMVSSWMITGFISVIYEYKVRVEEPFALFDELYDKPWTRLGPYLVGMFAGWFLFKTKCRMQISKFTTIACWCLSLLVLASLVYGVLNAQLGVTGSAIYISLGHTAWGLALAWIVIACCTGHGGYINTMLSFRLLHPLSRLTYCAYLIHPVLMACINFQMDGPLHLHNALVMVLYFGNIVAAFLLSFGLSMMFEAPVVRLLKVALSPKPTRTNSIEE